MPYVFKGRPWEIKSYYTLDIFDSICSSIRVDIINNNVVRLVPCINEELNEEWMTNKARFSYDALSIQRIQQPMCMLHGNFISISWEIALEYFVLNLYKFKFKLTEVIVGPFSIMKLIYQYIILLVN